MKLPRWLMIGMWTSSVLLPLAAAGWWWVTWPERTAIEFTELLTEGKASEAKDRFGWIPQWSFDGINYLNNRAFWSPSNLHPHTRTLSELVTGRQRFDVGPPGDVVLTINRGKVKGECAISIRLGQDEFDVGI